MLPSATGGTMSYRILDRGLDEMAASTRTGFWPRLAASIAVGLVSLACLPAVACAAWAAWAIGWDVISWLGTRDQQLGRPIRQSSRLIHITSLVCGVTGWVTLGVLLWTTGTAAGALCGV